MGSKQGGGKRKTPWIAEQSMTMAGGESSRPGGFTDGLQNPKLFLPLKEGQIEFFMNSKLEPIAKEKPVVPTVSNGNRQAPVSDPLATPVKQFLSQEGGAT